VLYNLSQKIINTARYQLQTLPWQPSRQIPLRLSVTWLSSVG